MSLHQLANHMSARGRGPDSTLVHMSPREVEGLQKLAVAHGTTLTINPDTGLPEAGALDSLLPILIGGVAGLAGIPSWIAALGTGAVKAATGGNLLESIAAGAGAYTGGSIAGGLTSLGEGVLQQQAGAAASQGLEGVAADRAAEQAITTRMADASMLDKLGAGASKAVSDPMSALSAIGGGSKLRGGAMLAGAIAPMFAGEVGNTVQTVTPRPSTRPRQPSVYDPQSQTFERYAAKGGLMGLAHGGAVRRFDEGGISLDTMYKNVLGREADTGGRAFWESQFGDKVDDTELAAFRASALGGTDTADKTAAQSFGAPASTTGQGFAAAAPVAQAPVAQAPVAQAPVAQAGIAALPSAGAATAGTATTNQGNNGAQLAALAANADMNAGATTAGIASLANTTGASNNVMSQQQPSMLDQVQGLYKNVLDRSGPKPYSLEELQYWSKEFGDDGVIDANEVAKFKSAAQKEIDARTADFDSSKNYIPISKLDDLYMQELSRHGEYGKDGKEGGMEFWRRTFGDYINPEELAGFRTEAAKERAAREAATRTNVVTDLTKADTTYVKDGVGGSTGAGQIGGGTVINPNGTITTSPVIPGIPVGGFTGMDQARTAYTTGGGSLGYTSPTYTATTFADKYKNTGYQKEMYDYLMGKGDKPTKMKNADGTFREIMRPYKEATLGVPGSTNVKRIWNKEKGEYFRNPDYMRRRTIRDPDTKEKSVINYMSINQAKAALAKTPLEGDALANWSIKNFVDPETLAEATGMTENQITTLLANAKADKAFGKEGGLMSLANGGLAAGGMPDKEFTDNTTGIKYYFDFANGMYRAETSVKDGITYRWNPVSNKYEPVSSSGAGTGIASLAGGDGGSPAGGESGQNIDRREGSYDISSNINPYTGSFQALANGPVGYAVGKVSGLFGPRVSLNNAPVEDVAGTPTQAAIDYGKSSWGKTGDEGQDIGTVAPDPYSVDSNVDGGGTTGGNYGSNGPSGDPALNAKGGYIGHYAQGGLGSLGGYSDGGRLLRGPGDGVSDSIPASIGNRQPARLADGEFVVPARIVSELGNGSTEAGARALYKMMARIQANRRKTTGRNRVAVDSKSHKYLPA